MPGPVSRALDAVQRSKVDVIFIDDLDRFLDAGEGDSVYKTITTLLLTTASGYMERPTTVVVAGPRRHLAQLLGVCLVSEQKRGSSVSGSSPNWPRYR
jgi:hypothetical protein